MGEQVDSYSDPNRLRLFMRALLSDVMALERMIQSGVIETGIRRIGAEQELCLVDRSFRPTRNAEKILAELDRAHFTPELGTFNLEFNLSPVEFGGDCLSRLEGELNRRMTEAREAAAKHGSEVIMAGILPTLRKTDLDLDAMMPRPRFLALNAALKRLRGGEFELRLTGTDELILKHDNVMLEACNTSCQVHFQVDPTEFAKFYNIAQVVTSPVLAAAVNSPFLFGKRLWKETRIALFQQAVDTRPTGNHVLDRSARVSFGEDWVRGSILDIFREDIARFRVVLGIDIDEDPLSILENGGIPKLKALQLHNSTVYRWNRPCYGVLDGKPNLRIENRALPAGPSVRDEVANAAFWFGLVSGTVELHPDVTTAMTFDNAKNNFLAAARQGLDAQFEGFGGRTVPARELILKKLIPLAREGLQASRIDEADIDKYLGTIEARVRSGRTGAMWQLASFRQMGGDGSVKNTERMGALVSASLKRQKEGTPVHEWELADVGEAQEWRSFDHCVEQYMTTELFTVHRDEVIDLVANVMDWKHIRHVPVEDDDGKLVGIVSYRSLLRLLARDLPHHRERPVPVAEVMAQNVVTCSPKTTTLEAIRLMREKKVACLPVTVDGRLVGIVSERDFLRVAGALLDAQLQGNATN
ncbi:MAG TPA: CBS domain-containing protein [bacterium]|nr:CBS domain-containing protein [bacterium]